MARSSQESSSSIYNLSDLLPYLSEGFCSGCKEILKSRLQNLDQNRHQTGARVSLPALPPQTSPNPNRLCLWKHENTPSVQSVSNAVSKLSVNGNNPTVSNSDELKRMSRVGRKKDFTCIEKINGRPLNVLEGLELHTRVFDDQEQKQIVDQVYNLQKMGQSGKLRSRTYSEPRKWMKGKGRITIQFGCCYNYAVDRNGNPPGIIRDEEVDPIPDLFKKMIKRMVQWQVLPANCIPNSCIVNIYDEGDCIPPHIDHHDFVRPFCTVSFLTESKILFGSTLKVVAPGEFSGSAAIPLPGGSVLVLKGNGADVAKHCVPAVRGKRISITFRKMDDSKLPFKFLPDPDLKGIQPLVSSHVNNMVPRPVQQVSQPKEDLHHQSGSVQFGQVDFPPLGASSSAVNRLRSKRIN